MRERIQKTRDASSQLQPQYGDHLKGGYHAIKVFFINSYLDSIDNVELVDFFS